MRGLLRVLKWETLTVTGLFAAVLVCIVVFVWVDPPASSLMLYRTLQGRHVVAPRPLALKLIPGYARSGIIYLEDHNFRTHFGIVWGAIVEAWDANQRLGYEAYGGSTITQQLARTLFLIPEKNWVRKGAEAMIAVLLEVVLSKDRILELYLNNIEWGPGVFGIEAGSRYQFGTGVRNLSKEQLARLLAIITSPVKYSVKTYSRNPGMSARYKALMGKP